MHTMNLHTRVAVYCRGKNYGILRKVVVDPEDGHITDLVVEPAAHAASVRIVPVSLVTYVDINQVHLGLNAAQIDRYPTYPYTPDKPAGRNPFSAEGLSDDESGREVPSLPATLHTPNLWRSNPDPRDSEPSNLWGGKDVQPSRISPLAAGDPSPGIIAPGTPVLCADGQLATVKRAVVDPTTRRLTHLTLRGPRTSGYRVVPISGTTPGCNGLILTPSAWNKLPRYVPRDDTEIRAEIRGKVLAELDIGGRDLEELDVSVNDGFVTLLGTLKGETLLAEVVARVSTVSGVIDLRTQVDLVL